MSASKTRRRSDLIDRAGMRVGMLTVISIVEDGARSKRRRWYCKCDCGNVIMVHWGSLKRGGPTSCGCMPRQDYVNRVGHKYDWLTVLRLLPERGKYNELLWECVCDCGNIVVTGSSQLHNKQARHCGCKTQENKLAANACHATHGMSDTRLYRVWRGMKDRCYNPSAHAYSYYGGIGIVVCDAWRNSFECFSEWAMSHGYSDDLSIDRFPDPFGNYYPENCRWATPTEQSWNLRVNLMLTYNGETRPLLEWASLVGLHRDTIRDRIERGWLVEQALTFAPDKTQRVIPKKKKGERSNVESKHRTEALTRRVRTSAA